MSKGILLLGLPVVALLVSKSEGWEEGEWLKRQTRKAALAAFKQLKSAKRYLTDPDLLPRYLKRNDNGNIVRIERWQKR